MGRILGFLILIITALVGGYTLFVFRGDSSTDPIVKLIGPGMTPNQCVARLRPQFEKMEPAMREIADALLASDQLVDITPSIGTRNRPVEEWSFYVNTTGFSSNYELSDDELKFFREKFRLLPFNHYYVPQRFYHEGEHVSVLLAAKCGIPILNWIGLQIGLGTYNHSRPSTIGTGLIYHRGADLELSKCPKRIKDPDPVISCQIPLNDDWSWVSDWTSEAAFEKYQSQIENIERE